MIWIILGIVVFVIITINIWRDSSNGLIAKLTMPIGALFLVFMCSLLCMAFTSKIVSTFADVKYYLVSDIKITALKDNQNVNGNFYIMGGYVNEDLYYYYAAETDLGYKINKIKADNVYIKYTNGETHIQQYRGDFVNDKLIIFGVPLYDDRYVIYCPDGTVTNEFNIDLE